ncbi:MAG: PAS domain-containing protein [Nitrospira sp.]|nr:PAS domain-containing protein [Nitrospira sp.]
MNQQSEHTQTEQALRESETKYRELFESSRDAIMLLFPPEWKFITCNPATVALFGAKSIEHFTTLGPWDVSPLLQPDGQRSADKAPKVIRQAMEDGSHFFEWTHRRINGPSFAATVLLTRITLKGQTGLQATV